MSHQFADNWRQPQNSRPRYQHNWSANQNGRRPKKDWSDINNRADDQIAPRRASGSIGSLERWALATADLPQQGHRFNEAQIITRIQQRYDSSSGSSNTLMPRYSNVLGDLPRVDEHSHHETYSRNLIHGGAMKHRRSISPPPLGHAPPQQELSPLAYMRSSKRQRTRSPSLARVPNTNGSKAVRVTMDLAEEDDYDYAQSSEWSFPSSEDEQEREIVDLT